MQAMTTSKYVGIQFQGKEGTLIIHSEKVIFRPKLTASEKEAAMTLVARSWRWAAIDRLEILDPPRQAPTHRSLKLKSKMAEHKAVTLIVPEDLLDDLVQDMNQRLSSNALGVEGIMSPVVKKNIIITARRNSTGPLLVPSSEDTKLKTTSFRPRRASMPEQLQVVAPHLVAEQDSTANKIQAHKLPPAPADNQAAEEEKPSPKRFVPFPDKIKASVKAAVKTTTAKIPLPKSTPPQVHKAQPETTDVNVSAEAATPPLKADSAAEQEPDSPPIVVSPIKRPLLGLLHHDATLLTNSKKWPRKLYRLLPTNQRQHRLIVTRKLPARKGNLLLQK
jgi:hypothetical protein